MKNKIIVLISLVMLALGVLLASRSGPVPVMGQKRTPAPPPVYTPVGCVLTGVPERYLNLAIDAEITSGCVNFTMTQVSLGVYDFGPAL